MARDYAKQPKKKKRQQARRNPPAKKQAEPMPIPIIPFWVWLASGIIIGFVAAYMLISTGYIQPAAPAKSVTPQISVEQTTKPKEAETKPAPQNKTKTEFDFYTELPNKEVEASERPTQPKDEAEYIYILQAGSFKAAEDADRMRAQLLLMNLDASVDKISSDKGTYYRVNVGPFKSRSKVSQTRNKLLDQGIKPLLRKLKVEK